ncbi:MAG: phospholipid carrier-dependent glycosyltransferase [Gemmatimonadota bacterium]|nr:phospholipid carrier-dependent glycosyltransferase [Gemmatimonadota bacterium]
MPPTVEPRPAARRRELEPYALFAVALATRFWQLSQPRGAIFDEELYEQYISHYFTHTFYFNLHPPVGKLVLALGAWLLRIDPVALAQADPAVTLRLVPALAGSLVIPVFYVLLRQLGATRRVATMGAFLLLCDNLLFVLSRYILIDALLLLFMLGSVSAYLASRGRIGRERWALVVLAALLAGLAVGTKWSGIAALGLVGVVWLRAVVRGEAARPALAMEAALLAVIPAAVYLAAFSVHLNLLPFSGGRDDTVMSPAFQATLVHNPAYRHDASVPFLTALRDAHVAMLRGNGEYVGDRNPNASPWWRWPVPWRPPYVWNSWGTTPGEGAHVVLAANPVVWLAALLGLAAYAVILAAWPVGRARLAPHRDSLWLLTVAWAASYLPYALVTRELFVYSYVPAMTFSLGLAAMLGGTLAGWMRDDPRGPWRFAGRRSAAAYLGVGALAFAAYAYLRPLGTGEAIPDAAWAHRRVLIGR